MHIANGPHRRHRPCEYSDRPSRRSPSCVETSATKFNSSRRENEHLRSLVRAATADLKSPEGAVWTVDVDPLDMM